MTLLEAIQSNPIFNDLTINLISSVLISRSIDGAAIYQSSLKKELELASADLYYAMATLPEIKEGGLGLKYSAKALMQRAESIYRRYQDEKLADFTPTKIEVKVARA